jgi:hypothetical protein
MPVFAVGCGASDGAPPSPATEQTAQEHYDAFQSKVSVDRSGSVHVDAPMTFATTNGTLEDALQSIEPQPPALRVICGGDQDAGFRICCNSSHCCINIAGSISCGD